MEHLSYLLNGGTHLDQSKQGTVNAGTCLDQSERRASDVGPVFAESEIRAIAPGPRWGGSLAPLFGAYCGSPIGEQQSCGSGRPLFHRGIRWFWGAVILAAYYVLLATGIRKNELESLSEGIQRVFIEAHGATKRRFFNLAHHESLDVAIEDSEGNSKFLGNIELRYVLQKRSPKSKRGGCRRPRRGSS